MYIPVCLPFSAKVVQFNRERASPDVSQEENPHIPSETGFRYSRIRRAHLLKCGCWLKILLSNTCQQRGSIKGACFYSDQGGFQPGGGGGEAGRPDRVPETAQHAAQ